MKPKGNTPINNCCRKEVIGKSNKPKKNGQQSICGTTLARLIKNHQQDILSVDLRDL
jgi:hypothetical protein